uniref:Serpentine receptor class gamma n=1 Tax=Caenorhabditis tropicalis TaxID=1561998 RepID=A0A1I7TFV6_9PELO
MKINNILTSNQFSAVSHGGALALFYSQFQSSFKISMLLEEHNDIGFTTFNQASLSYAFYMSLCALFSLYIPPLTLVVFTEKIALRSRSKTPTNFDPTLMLY